MTAEPLKAILFQARIIVIIEVVHPEHLVPALQQCSAQVSTYEPGCAGDQTLAELDRAPDVFLCDMEMPRMNGIELIRQIREQAEFKITPIVMVTSRATEKHRHKAYEAGATDYVVKPFNDENLLGLINELVTTSREFV